MRVGSITKRDLGRLTALTTALVGLGIATVAGATPAAAAAKGTKGARALKTPVASIPTTSTTTTSTTSTTSTTAPTTTTPTTTSTTVASPTTTTSGPSAVMTEASTTVKPRKRSRAPKIHRAAVRPRRAPTRQAATVELADAVLGTRTAVTLPAGIADDCSTDVSTALAAWLNGLPAGSTWTPPASACFRIDKGLQLRFLAALTIDGGTFEDLNTTAPAQNGGATNHGHPAFEFLGGSDITLENMRIVGAHKGWSYRPALAFQGGIQLDGTEGATIANVSITKTIGDGINLEPLRGGSDYRSGRIVDPVENLTVSNVTIKQAGRQGITGASVNGATFTNVSVTGVAFNAFDFEADQSGEGAKNVLIDGCTFSGINISMGGAATGPITVRNCTMPKTDHGDAVRIVNTTGKPMSGPIVFSDDVLRCAASVYVSCFQLGGASDMTVQNSNVTIGFHHDAIHESAYTVSNGSHVTFADDVVHGFGRVATTRPGSTATVTGGAWTGLGCRAPAVCPAR